MGGHAYAHHARNMTQQPLQMYQIHQIQTNTLSKCYNINIRILHTFKLYKKYTSYLKIDFMFLCFIISSRVIRRNSKIQKHPLRDCDSMNKLQSFIRKCDVEIQNSKLGAMKTILNVWTVRYTFCEM